MVCNNNNFNIKTNFGHYKKEMQNLQTFQQVFYLKLLKFSKIEKKHDSHKYLKLAAMHKSLWYWLR